MQAFASIDVNADGKLDCLFSNHERYSLHLFKDMKEGWAIKVIDVRARQGGREHRAGDSAVRPGRRHEQRRLVPLRRPLARQNEDTWRLPDHVFKFTFAEMLAGKASGGREAPR